MLTKKQLKHLEEYLNLFRPFADEKTYCNDFYCKNSLLVQLGYNILIGEDRLHIVPLSQFFSYFPPDVWSFYRRQCQNHGVLCVDQKVVN